MKSKFSSVVLGCMDWGNWRRSFSATEMADMMHHGLSEGLTTFDHADIYGDYTVEAQFGQAFKESKIDRSAIQIITKCGIQYPCENRPHAIKHYQYDTDYIIHSAEASIKALNCDYLDAFLLHRPSPLMDPDAIAKAADHLQSQGKVVDFGVSNFTPSQSDLVHKRAVVGLNQIEVSLTHLDPFFNGSLDHMMTHDIRPMAWRPLGRVFKDKTEQSHRIHKVLAALCEIYDASKDQLLMAWLLKHPSRIIPVIGTTNKERITAAAGADKIHLSEIHWFELLVASQGHKVP